MKHRIGGFVTFAFACTLAGSVVACNGNGDDDQPGIDGSPPGTDGGPPDADGGPVSTTACAVDVAARGPHTCIFDEDGAVSCWGRNHRGQLGIGSTSGTSEPTEVELPDEVIEVQTGIAHTCALLASGEVFCWGFGGDGTLGNGATGDETRPVRVEGIQATELFVGGFHACALDDAGTLSCWGDNASGQIGDGASGEGADRTTPVAVASGVESAALGEEHSCALLSGGQVQCWGSNERGQLGDGSTDDRPSAAPVLEGDAPMSGADRVVAGAYHTCAVKGSGALLCWGRDDFGQLGGGAAGEDRPEPVRASGVSGPAEVAAGIEHTCARASDGAVSCWGGNEVAQLGTGDFERRLEPTPVADLGSAEDLGAGDLHTCAVVEGDVFCWGYNANGQAGRPAGAPIDRPVQVLDCE